MAEYLRLIKGGDILLDELTEAKYLIEKVYEAFGILKTHSPKPLMVILDYEMSDISNLEAYLHHDRNVIVNNAPIKRVLLI